MIKVPGLRFHPEVQENVVYSLYIPVRLCLDSGGQKSSTCFLKIYFRFKTDKNIAGTEHGRQASAF